MSRTRHTDEQKARIVREFENYQGSTVDFRRQRGISSQTFTNWRRRAETSGASKDDMSGPMKHSSAISTNSSPAEVRTATSGFTAASPATSSSTGRPAASTGTRASGSGPTTKASFRAMATKPMKTTVAPSGCGAKKSPVPPASPTSGASLKAPAPSDRK